MQLTKFLLSNQVVSVSDSSVHNRDAPYLNEISLDYTDFMFAFEFSTLRYQQTDKVKYAYQLEGLNEEWVETDAQNRRITFTGVPHGNYTFKAKAANDLGEWGEEISVPIVIRPPWWKTWWAQTLWLSLAVTALLSIYFIRVRSLKYQQEKLEAEVNRQTKELRERSEEISQQKEEITQQKEEIEVQAEELKVTNERLVELDEYKQSLTGMIVHDLKNPLNAIIGLTEGDYEPKYQQKLNQSGKSMLNLVLNILEVQKLEEASTQLSLKEHNLLQLWQEALHEVHLLAEEKSIHINFDIDLSIWVKVDQGLMVRVFINLLTNAIKYSPQNGTIAISHSILNKADDTMPLTIYVKDNGIGIPKEKQAEIFHKFGQVDGKKSGSVRSTGLGLTFCKMALEAHEQQIGVESEEGQGACFWLSLDYSLVSPNTELIKSLALVGQGNTKSTGIHLSTADILYLQPFASQIQQYEVYEVSEVKEVLQQIPPAKNDCIQAWRSAVEDTLYACNEEKYHALLQEVIDSSPMGENIV